MVSLRSTTGYKLKSLRDIMTFDPHEILASKRCGRFSTHRHFTFDLHEIFASKRAFRISLASRDVAEKLRMLDALRECALALQATRQPSGVHRNAADRSAMPKASQPVAGG